MKRVIYILTAIFSAVIAAVFIIEYITSINENGKFFLDIYRCTLIPIILALGVLSAVQLKKHTPRIVLILCGYVFYTSVLTINSQYLFGLLLMAAALMPAIYEFSHYGMAVRQEPKTSEKSRWPLIAAFALAVAMSACRVMLIIMQAAVNMYPDFWYFSMDYMGISALLFTAAFCALMDRRTSVLYRMFFTGCILLDASQIVRYGLFSGFFPMDPVKTVLVMRTLFVFFEAICALFALLIFIHALLTRRGSLTSPITREAPDITQQAEIRS